MEVNTTSLNGYLRFRMLAALRRFRPKTFRYGEEQAAIAAWLSLIVEAATRSAEIALEVAACAGLIKGYGDTHERGTANYRLIEDEVIRPMLAGPAAFAADAIASARAAALSDPEGEALARCIAEVAGRRAFAVAAE
jgi:indolepyruvate ferredoxin oxidoreductase beta subunit